MLKFFALIEKYFGLCLILALGIGLFLPSFALVFQPYILYLVQIILFLSCLKIDFPSFIKTFKNPGWITYITFMVMILCPILFYTITKLFYPELAIGVLILTAMPTAMAAPAFTDITKGNTSLTLMFTIILTLLCPISIPLLIKYLLGVQIHIDLWEMFFMLIKVICIPFALALLTRNFLPSMIKKSKPYYGGLSIILLMLLIFPPLAVYRDYFFANPIKIFPMLIYLSLVSAGLHIFGWFISYRSPYKDKISISIVSGYMNLTLSIVFAMKFFGPTAIIAIILFDIPWTLMLIPFSYVVKKLRKG